MENRLIIDCFTFFNELKMLELRLLEMYDNVDYFVLVESTKTFTNLDKELYYQNNKNQFKKWKDKIIHIIVDDVDMPNTNDSWEREKFQRDACMKALNKMNLKPDDVVLITDVDEIINKQTLIDFKNRGVEGMYVLWLDTYIYSVKNKVDASYKDRIGTGARAINWESLLEIGTPDNVRNRFAYNKEYYPNGNKNEGQHAWILPNVGWHFTYFGGKEEILKK